MFGFAFGLLAFMLFAGFLIVAILADSSGQLTQRISALPFLYKGAIFGLIPYILGLLAQKGLERAVKDYSKR